MTPDGLIFTERLCLRQWKPSDIPSFYKLCSDPEVMEFFPFLMDQGQVNQAVKRYSNHIDAHGFGFFAVEDLAAKSFIGFIGMQRLEMEADFTPCIEIGWRLHKRAWGNGYATEGAEACIRFVFDKGISNEIYSFTAAVNSKSERVMQKLGMQHVGYFDHPKLASDSPLCRHTLYKIKQGDEVDI